MKQLWDHRYTFCLRLGLPAIAILSGGFRPETYENILHVTGEFSARLMIVAIMLTPLRMILPRVRWIIWLLQRRRYLGVAAFAYAALHLVAYILEAGAVSRITAELPELGIWTGWLALVIFTLMAMTSNNYSVRKLKAWWKSLQRCVYPAAVLTLIHWVLVTEEISGLVNFVPLAAVEAYRVSVNLRHTRKSSATS